MRQARITRAEFDTLVARAGLELSEDRKAELHRAYASLEMLIERLRAPLPPEAEPATIYAIPRDAQ